MSGKCALVLIANGSEETETVGVIDALRRAELEVTVASVSEQIQVKCSRGVNLVADVLLYTCHENIYDVIVLPGNSIGHYHAKQKLTPNRWHEGSRSVSRIEHGRGYGQVPVRKQPPGCRHLRLSW